MSTSQARALAELRQETKAAVERILGLVRRRVVGTAMEYVRRGVQAPGLRDLIDWLDTLSETAITQCRRAQDLLIGGQDAQLIEAARLVVEVQCELDESMPWIDQAERALQRYRDGGALDCAYARDTRRAAVAYAAAISLAPYAVSGRRRARARRLVRASSGRFGSDGDNDGDAPPGGHGPLGGSS